MDKYTLIKLTEGYIIFSSKHEEGISQKTNYFDDKVDKNGICKMEEAFTDEFRYFYITGIKEDFRLVHEIIASNFIPELPNIDFNNLEEEFGAVDIDKLSEKECDNAFSTAWAKDWWKIGFNKCLEFNKDKLYTKEQIKEVINKMKQYNSSNELCVSRLYTFDEAINLLQPKTEWDIEVKITNDSIKITKIL